MRNLAVFFDGTWNTPDDRTNVYKLYKLVDDIDQRLQLSAYIQGVGTESGGLLASFRNFLGGAFGDGLSRNIQQGYKWLAQVYEPGDRIYLFVFSRGAYSARSLAGLIRNCGVLKQDAVDKVDEAYGIYRDEQSPNCDSAKEFRARFAQETPVEFVGVWDTVGALGIPSDKFDLPGFRKYYQFHDTQLSNNVHAAYHAMAINEYRDAYAPAVWTVSPEQNRPGTHPVEQRWFIGAHSNVGGGYRGDVLCNPACRWMQKMAQKHGLLFLSDWPVNDDDYRVAPRKSYDEFVADNPAAKAVIEKIARDVNKGFNETLDPKVRAILEAGSPLLAEYPAMRQALLDLRTSES